MQGALRDSSFVEIVAQEVPRQFVGEIVAQGSERKFSGEIVMQGSLRDSFSEKLCRRSF